MAKKVRMKYEGETEEKMCGYACKVLVFALLTAVLFVGYSLNVMLGQLNKQKLNIL